MKTLTHALVCSPVLLPFVFAIQHNATGTLLFRGQMPDPSAG